MSERLERLKRAYTRTAPGGPRPLSGPKSHPYLREANALYPAVVAAPPVVREALIVSETAKLVSEFDAGFAEIVAFALRERLLARVGVDCARSRHCAPPAARTA